MSESIEQAYKPDAEYTADLFERLADAARKGKLVAYAICAQTEDEGSKTVTNITDFVVFDGPGEVGNKKVFREGVERISVLVAKHLADDESPSWSAETDG
jgi:hypothetical protein